jgi:hypothetical protein
MASLVLAGDTSGSITVSAPAVAGSNTQTLVAATDTLAPIIRGTAQASTSGTSIEFTGIPSWVKRITVMFQGVSTNSTGYVQVQLGSGSFTTSGYTTLMGYTGSSSGALSIATGFTDAISGASALRSGGVVLTNISGNNWLASYNVASVVGGSVYATVGGGSVSLSGVLDRLRVIGSATGTPSDTFDAGTINILYE